MSPNCGIWKGEDLKLEEDLNNIDFEKARKNTPQPPKAKTRVSEISKNEFSMAIEARASDLGVDLITSLTMTMVECSIDPESVVKMITPNLKKKLEKEASDNRTLKEEYRDSDLFDDF